MAAVQPLDGPELPEFVAFKAADKVVVDENLACIEVVGKMFVIYKILLSKNAQSKWTNIVASQINANPWTDLKGTVHAVPLSPLVQSFEDCVTFHLLTVFPREKGTM